MSEAQGVIRFPRRPVEQWAPVGIHAMSTPEPILRNTLDVEPIGGSIGEIRAALEKAEAEAE